MDSTKGFIRDRMSQIISIRNSNKNNLGNLPPPTFISENDTIQHYSFEIEAQFQDISGKLDSLSELYKKRIESMSYFTDEVQIESDITNLTDQITKQLNYLKNKVQNEELIQGGTETATIFTNMQKGYLARIRPLLIRFRKMQKIHLDQLNNIKSKVEQSLDSIDKDDPGNFEDVDIRFNQEQNQMIIQNAEEIQERNRMIDETLHLMEMIKPLFLDLQTLIQDQGKIIDRIDHNIDESLTEMANGNRELSKADRDQNSKCFYFYLIGMIILIVILGTIVIIKKEMKRKLKNDDN